MNAQQDDKPIRVTPEQLGDQGFLARFREFAATSYAVKHSTASVMLLIILLFVGLAAYGSIPRESAPEIEVPFVAVNTVYPGVSPSDIETLVTRPLEDELHTIADIKELRSTSTEGYSSITAEFNTNVNLDEALQKVREKVDLARPDLPADAEEPSIVEFNFSEFPIMQVNVSGAYGLVRLKEIAEELQDRLEQIPTVLRVDLSGGLEREVKVDVDLPHLLFYNVALDDVVEAIRNENVNIPGGSVDVGRLKYLVRVDGEIDNPSIIEDFVVAVQDGRPIYVRDVASVDYGFSERESFARLDSTPVVTLDVVKRSGQNIIETADAVKRIIAEMSPAFPPTTVVKITSDQSEEIHKMVNSLENNIISGLLLIVAVLLFFLGVRNSMFVAVSIPASMMLSFIVLKFLGVTMNMVVLFSLILALGMLVDNAIVVVENIYRYVEQGWDRVTAAKKATGEVAGPVISSTLTTLAAFAPMLFWPGIVGDFMGYLPLTLIVTLSSSLFVALVLIPTLCALFMRLDGAPAPGLTPTARWTLIGGSVFALLLVATANPLTAVMFAATGVLVFLMHHFVLHNVALWFQGRALPRIIGTYAAALGWCLKHRAILVTSVIVVFIGTVMAFGKFNNGVEFFPEDIPPAQVAVSIETPTGTSASATNAYARVIESELKKIDGMDDAESVVATVGGSGGNMLMGGGPGGGNTARVTVSFVDYEDRRQESFTTLANMQQQLGRSLAGVDVSVEPPQNGPPSGPPINIEIVGKDPEVLRSLADTVLYILRNDAVFPKLVGLESDLDAARPELFVRVDREKAALYDLSTFDVGSAIRGAIQGVEAAKYRTGNDEFDIVVRLAESYREDLYSVGDLKVFADGNPVPLTSVASWEVREGLGMIQRKDMDRVATISSQVSAGQNSNAVLGEVQAVLASFADSKLPAGYTLRYTGQNQEQAESQEFLTFAFILAITFIALILIGQFNSVVTPAVILTTVIMSTIGVLIGLMVFNMPFVIIMTGIGVISLAGIVVNNAIVLLDYVDTLRRRDGVPRRAALIRAGMTRFRPVVLTAVTTALGLIPLAIGLNFDFLGLYASLSPELYWGGEQASWWAPMAIAVIVGILFATFLTLLVVPVLYSIVDDISDWMKARFVAQELPEPLPPAPARERQFAEV
jgi:multidrug efflux pump subunit AcrB